MQEFVDNSDTYSVYFKVKLSEENMKIAEKAGLLKFFRLSTTISTQNMHLFDSLGNMKKYESATDSELL